MANKKFSEFVLKTNTSSVSHIVGYNGAENVQITPANFVTTGGTGVFLPLTGGTLTGALVVDSTATVNDILTAGLGLAVTGGTVGSSKLVLASTNKVHLSGGSAGLVLQNTSGTKSLTIDDTLSTFVGLVSGITPVDAANFVTKAYLDGGGGAGNGFLPLAGGTMLGNTIHNDNVRSIYGNPGNDLQIFHNGTDSIIEDSGTGNLNIKSNGAFIDIQSNSTRINNAANNEIMATFVANSSVSLYNNNSKKFETSTTGISVTGGGVFTGSLASVSIGTTGNDISFSRNSDNYINAVGGTSSNIVINPLNRFVVNTNNVERMRITSGGVIEINGVGSGLGFINAVNNGDGNDTGQITINGGGSDGDGRGAAVIMAGNENGNGGLLQLRAGLGSISQIRSYTNGTEKMRITAAGNVGIGNADPQFPLSVENSSTAYVFTETTGFSSSGYRWKTPDSEFAWFSTRGTNALNLYDYVANATRMIVDASGNLGIGIAPVSLARLTLGTGALSNEIISFAVGAGGGAEFRSTSATGFFKWTNNDGGAERMRLTAAGNLGVGTVSPMQKFDTPNMVIGGSTIAGVYRANSLAIDNNGGTSRFFSFGPNTSTNGSYTFNTANSDATTNPEALRITSDGNFGFVSPTITNPYGQANFTDLNINGTWGGLISFKLGNVEQGYIGQRNSGNGDMVLGSSASKDLLFNTNGNNERMRLTSAGNLCIGTTTTLRGNKFHVNANNLLAGFNVTGGTGEAIALFSNGTVVGSISVTGSATAYNTTSDYRLKEDLQDFKGLDLVSKIPVYDYKWKVDESRSYGVMAHQLQEVLPQAVTGEKDAEEMQSVDYSKIVPVLVKAIQELKAEIELLKK